MQTVSDIAEAILDREGGFVNDPDDPGGATNFGVTVHTMRRLGLDLDGDGDVDAADVRRLSKAEAREIFIRAALVQRDFDCRGLCEWICPTGAVSLVYEIIPAGPGRKRGVRRGRRQRRRRIIWRMPMGSNGGTITTRWPTGALRAGSMPGGRTAARGGGYAGPRVSSLPSTI